jgi:hypothetical protein
MCQIAVLLQAFLLALFLDVQLQYGMKQTEQTPLFLGGRLRPKLCLHVVEALIAFIYAPGKDIQFLN